MLHQPRDAVPFGIDREDEVRRGLVEIVSGGRRLSVGVAAAARRSTHLGRGMSVVSILTAGW